MEEILDRLDDQNGLVESKMNKFQNLKDDYEKQNLFPELTNLMKTLKNTVNNILIYFLA